MTTCPFGALHLLLNPKSLCSTQPASLTTSTFATAAFTEAMYHAIDG